MGFARAMVGYSEAEVESYMERLKSMQGAGRLSLECNVEALQEEIRRLEEQAAPLRLAETAQRQKLEEIRKRISDMYYSSILTCLETEQRFSQEEALKLEALQKRNQELERVRETMDQLCASIEKLTQGFHGVMEGQNNG